MRILVVVLVQVTNMCSYCEATDDAGTATQQTITVTITDTNDQTPTFSATAGSINYAEMATSAADSFTITDTDTTGTLACAESGADAALLSCSISGTTLTVSWDASPDFETKADSGANGVYDYTITVSDGTNDASAVSYAITVTMSMRLQQSLMQSLMRVMLKMLPIL